MSSRYITIFETASGQIVDTDEIEAEEEPTLEPGQDYVEGEFDGDTIYLPAGVETDRPVVDETLIDGEVYMINFGETLTFALVAGTEVTDVDSGQTFVSVGSETLQISSEINGEFEFAVTPPFPYQAALFTVIVDAD